MSDAQASARRQLRVFLCHASADKARVRELYERLLNDGFQPWLDEEDILPGQRWQVEIPKAVRVSDIVLVCLSAHSTNKEGYIQKEIRIALDAADEKPEETIFLIPVRLEECTVPERIAGWQWVNLFQPKGYARLLQALRVRAESLGIEPAIRAAASTNVSPGTVKVNPKEGLEYIWVPPGDFLMGATQDDSQASADEKPRHRVRITRGFWMGKTPVTVAAYSRFVEASGRKMPSPPDFNPKWQHRDHPVVNVTWTDAKGFCEWAGGRLPTEAQWEYAARGGKAGFLYPWGNDLDSKRANFQGSGTTPVLQFPAQNEWGFQDLAGNVWEWVADWYGEEYYSTLNGQVEDPAGPETGSARVMRGGSWVVDSRDLRASNRFGVGPVVRDGGIGFRCAREVPFP